VGGNISVSGGDDQVLIHGGQVAGSVLMSIGNDRFSWTGGRIGTRVDMGPGDDTAQLQGLASDALVIPLDGGTGSDSLTLFASQAKGGARYLNWERIELAGGSRFSSTTRCCSGMPAVPPAPCRLLPTAPWPRAKARSRPSPVASAWG
jgi:hypothetical protein